MKQVDINREEEVHLFYGKALKEAMKEENSEIEESKTNEKREKKTPYRKPCQHRMMDFLAKRNYSEKELRQKLTRSYYQYTEDEINEAIQYAKDHNYLLPPEELSRRIALQLHQKNKGFLYINNYLREKGLPPVNKDSDLEIRKALDIIGRRFSLEESNSISFDEKQKIQRQLYNRGFDLETIKKVIHEKL